MGRKSKARSKGLCEWQKMKNYENLFNAIWVQAVKDESLEVRRKAQRKGRDIAYKLYIEKTGEEVEKRDERFKKII